MKTTANNGGGVFISGEKWALEHKMAFETTSRAGKKQVAELKK